MRQWIKLFESPIADLQVLGDPRTNEPFNSGYSFGAADKKLLQSPKAIQKVYRAFKNTPFVFEIFFINNKEFDGDNANHNNDVDRFAERLHAGVYTTPVWGIPPKPGVIRLVMLGNLSPVAISSPKIPLTPWIISHKMLHAVQDEYLNGTKTIKNLIAPSIKRINNLIDRIGNESGRSRSGLYNPEEFDSPEMFMQNMTTRSARKNYLNNGFEVFPELGAQYLISGKITLNNKNEPLFAPLIEKLNMAYTTLFRMLRGKVLLEL